MNDRVDETLLAPAVLWSPGAETSLLGALLLENGLWDRVGDLVSEADFFKNEHKLIFGALSIMLNACKGTLNAMPWAGTDSRGARHASTPARVEPRRARPDRA